MASASPACKVMPPPWRPTSARCATPWIRSASSTCSSPTPGLGDAFRELIDIPTADVPRVYKEIFDLNVLAVIIGARVAVTELVKTGGSIIVTLSNSSFYPDGGGVMYIASKHAALGIVRQLAHEFAPLVRVNGVSPGATKTDIRMPASFGLDEQRRANPHAHASRPTRMPRSRPSRPLQDARGTRGSLRRVRATRLAA